MCYNNVIRLTVHELITFIERNLVKQEYEVTNEPKIRTNAGLRKTDSIAKMGQTAIVMNAQIVNYQIDLSNAHKQKTDLYKNITNIKKTWNVKDGRHGCRMRSSSKFSEGTIKSNSPLMRKLGAHHLAREISALLSLKVASPSAHISWPCTHKKPSLG
ncbi:hypothetical protein PUN28_017883 [Cardiocondyla obscurior]|uniref:Uncharacterized protein n=1 Tax=Cardiocondyla obscurior TaxID=286306 RepID=A0AAW2ENP0_9HYME